MNRRAFIAALSTAGLLHDVAILHSSAEDIPNVALFGFRLINTSIEPTSADDEQRIRMLDDLLQQQLASSGQFHIVPIAEALRQEIANGPGIANCNGCQREYAQKAGADWAAWGTVQKVSNLILNINLYMEDERTGQLQFAKSVDIRGNTDKSWRRGSITYFTITYWRHANGIFGATPARARGAGNRGYLPELAKRPGLGGSMRNDLQTPEQH